MKFIEYADRWINPAAVEQVRVMEGFDGGFGVVVQGSNWNVYSKKHETVAAAIEEAKAIVELLEDA